MLKITCPWCGPRIELEFKCGGEAHIARPENPEDLSNEEWADFLFMRTNTKGWHRERWNHVHGCRQWFNAIRSTVTHEFAGTYKIGEKPSLEDLTKLEPVE